MIPEGSDPVTIVWKATPNTCPSGSHMELHKVCCSDDSVEAAQKHLYKWVPYDTPEVCYSDDREEAAQKHLLNGSHTKPHIMPMDLLL